MYGNLRDKKLLASEAVKAGIKIANPELQNFVKEERRNLQLEEKERAGLAQHKPKAERIKERAEELKESGKGADIKEFMSAKKTHESKAGSPQEREDAEVELLARASAMKDANPKMEPSTRQAVSEYAQAAEHEMDPSKAERDHEMERE